MTRAPEVDREEAASLLRARLNLETGRIAWRDLQRFFASGQTIYVAPELDLVEVACAVASDAADAVRGWTASGLMAPVSDAQAREWYEAEAALWSVVVKPWVLVQPLGG